MSEARTIARYGQIYAIANLVSRAGGLILVPVYTHMLTLEDYGVYTLLFTLMDLMSLVFGMGISKAMGRFYFDHPEDSAERNRVISTTLLGFAAIAAVFCCLSYPIAWGVVRALELETRLIPLFALAGGAMAVAVLFEIVVGYMVIRKRAWSFLALAIAKSTLMLAFNGVFVVWLELGVAGIVYALAASFGCLALLSSLWCLATVGLRFDGRLLGQLIRFGLPLVPSAFANSAIRLTERSFITQFGGVAALATYGLADRLTSLLQMFIATPFSQIFTVRRFESISNGENQSQFHTVFLLFVAVIAFASLLLSGFGAEALALLAPEQYAGALALLPVLGLCHILSAINLNIELGILYQKKTHIIPIIAILSLALAVALNWILVQRYGAMGAAIAFLVVNIVRLCLTVAANWRWGTREIKLDWPRACTLLGISLCAGLAFVDVFGPAVSLQSGVIKAAILAALFIAALFSPAFDTAARSTVLSRARRSS